MILIRSSQLSAISGRAGDLVCMYVCKCACVYVRACTYVCVHVHLCGSVLGL